MDDYSMESDLTIESMAIRSILSNKSLYHPMKGRFACIDKEKDYNDVYNDASAAFLGPNIWDKASEFKMDYLDLDALLNGSEHERHKMNDCNGMNNNEKGGQHHHMSAQEIPNITQEIPNLVPVMHSRHMTSSPADSSSLSDIPSDNDNRMYAVDCKFSPRDLALATPPGQDHYDPTSTIFPDEELKPQPIIKKSRKNFVPDKLKDDKYWARRHKNNIAARRSREARRLKENQIVLRASYLEKENNSLKDDVMRLKAENDMLKNQLKKFQS